MRVARSAPAATLTDQQRRDLAARRHGMWLAQQAQGGRLRSSQVPARKGKGSYRRRPARDGSTFDTYA